MIPKNDGLIPDMEYEEQPSYTFRMNLEKEEVKGNCDDLDAVRQAVYLILNIELYSCTLVSWNYGVELEGLFGMPTTYCIPEIERRITEALMQDDRITKVYNFSFDVPRKGVIHTTFSVDSTAGTINAEKEVTV